MGPFVGFRKSGLASVGVFAVFMRSQVGGLLMSSPSRSSVNELSWSRFLLFRLPSMYMKLSIFSSCRPTKVSRSTMLAWEIWIFLLREGFSW